MKALIVTIIIAVTGLLGTAVQAKIIISDRDLIDLADSAGDLFRRANASAKSDPLNARKLYTQAILRYNLIIDGGQISNGSLYYNIANAYLLQGDIGRAILNYRRAQPLTADDMELSANLQQNLSYALQQRRDQVPVKTQKKVLRTLFFWHYDFGLKTKFLLATLLWCVAWLAGAVRLLRQRGTFAVWLLTGSLVLACSFAGSIGLDIYHARNQVNGVIVADEVIARQGDGMNYSPSFKEPIHSGTEFKLRQKRADWLHIELSNGIEAWIPKESAELI